MHRIQKIILISIISITAISWILSKDQPDMMTAMMNYNPVAISLFTISWTIGMAAMMFPAITPMVLLYSRLVKNSSSSGTSNSGNTDGEGTNSPQSSVFVEPDDDKDDDKTAKRENKLLSLITSSILSTFRSSVNIIFFVCSYLLVWAITGIVLLLAWSILVNYFFVHFEAGQQQHQVQLVYGIVLIISGVYQFSSLKTKCIGYCESPLSFFMRRWRGGTIGAVKMGVYHGLYCLGCCWPYFLLMIALGWMNLIWMALFASIIFGEKIWSKGVWIARSAGIGFAIVGIMTICGVLTIIPTGMNNNNPTNGDDNMHMGGMNMDMNKNLNAANKPTSTKMMPSMNDM
jgi:predicted metal-binding membrane protein